MSKVILQAKNLNKVYKIGNQKLHAVNDVSLTIEQGEFISILGKSGSGKSTLMHMIGLLDTPTSGQIILEDKDVSNLNEKRLAKIRNKQIGFIFQSFNLLQRTTALDNVILPLQYSDVPESQWKDKALTMLETVELADRINNKSNELSGGQKQRVAIARALINDPSIIFADEPTGNLDSKTGDAILALFSKLNKQGKTLVIVTHDEDIAMFADRRIVLKDGKLIEDTGKKWS